MDPATLEMQVFISLIVVLATAFVALICDYLKGSNESLRERNIELMVRREERQKLQAYEALDWLQQWVGTAQRPVASRESGRQNPVYAQLRRTPVERPEAPVTPVERPVAAPSLLQTLTIPDWIQKEQQARAMARAAAVAKGKEARVAVPEPAPVAAPVVAPVAPKVELLPAGYHGAGVLSGLLKESRTVSGVVVSVGLDEHAAQRAKMTEEEFGELTGAVQEMLQGMLRDGIDFGCLSGEDEYVLVFQLEHGAEAQRRLTQISEALWSFQLRTMPGHSGLFAWGAVEVANELIADAVASASERMHQARRNRKTIPLDASRRKVVNG